MTPFLSGAIVVAAVTISLFFFKAYRSHRDRLFGYFSLAFLVLAVDWTALGLLPRGHPLETHLYVVRLGAFVLIIWGIVEKNRRR